VRGLVAKVGLCVVMLTAVVSPLYAQEEPMEVTLADGTNPRQFTTGPAKETQPCWSPEGYFHYVREMKHG